MRILIRRIARRERERRNDKRVVTRTNLQHCGLCGCRVQPYQDLCGACLCELVVAQREVA